MDGNLRVAPPPYDPLRPSGRAAWRRQPVAAAAISGHFGELIQGRFHSGGPVALVTLPAPDLRVTARLAARGPFALRWLGAERPIAFRQIAALFRQLTGGAPRGRLTLRSGMPAGGGAGSSTAALVAVATAIAQTAGRPADPNRLAELCLALEGASDPLMHAAAGRLLWAPRQARILAELPPPPALDIVGGFFGPGQRTDPGDERFADIADLVAAWGPIADRGDAAALAGLATESARRNAAVRGGPDPSPLLALAARFGALGIVAAHTGSARGLIFAAGLGDAGRAAAALGDFGARGVIRFRLAGVR